MAGLKAPKNSAKNVEKEKTEQVVEQEVKTEEGTTAVATDNVPEGEPKENPDGSVTTYDEDNNPVGTASAEEVKKAEESVSGITVDHTPPTKQLNEDAPKVEVNTSSAPDTSKKPEERVRIRLRVDHNCCIAMEFYEFKAGKVYHVPKNVKRILNRAGLLAPVQ